MTRIKVGLTQRADSIAGRERRDALDQRWPELLDAAGFLPIPIPNRLADAVSYLDELDLGLLILSGGNDLDALPDPTNSAPERDSTEQQLLAAAAARRVPVLGVCRGLQSMLHFDGARLHRVDGHVGEPHAIEVVVENRWPLRSGRVVNSFHDWAIVPGDLGPNFDALALAPDGTVEAAQHRSQPQVGVMWHPERAPEDDDDLALVRALAGVR